MITSVTTIFMSLLSHENDCILFCGESNVKASQSNNQMSSMLNSQVHITYLDIRNNDDDTYLIYIFMR